MTSLRTLALQTLLEADPTKKAEAARALDPLGEVFASVLIPEPAGIPGRPVRPELVAHTKLKRRSVHTPHGRAVLVHALAHIEFNAIDLALDLAWRFPGMPDEFYRDWIVVAREEALHFQLLRAHLQTMGHDYGDFAAHDSLWQMAEKTRHDLLARIALVPRTLEARGLDASPPIRAKLAAVGDEAGAAILDLILRDEIGHVAIGNRWYRHLCAERGLDPVATYAEMATRYDAPRQAGPFNVDARLAAGFTGAEIEWLEAQAPARASRAES